ncbi:MAG: hypothetical protein ACRDYC_11285, partial [Acidimicrobiales bacterium]
MRHRVLLAALATAAGLALTGCGSGASTSTGATNATTATTATGGAATTPTTSGAAGGAPVCPTLAQAETALGASYSSLV